MVQLIQSEDDGSAIELARHGPGMHKLLLMDEDLSLLAEVRPWLEALASKCGVTVTQALPTMLKLLPAGCSKARGMVEVCEASPPTRRVGRLSLDGGAGGRSF